MNDNISDQVIDSSNLPANKKAKAIQKRRAAENSYEALQLNNLLQFIFGFLLRCKLMGFPLKHRKLPV